MERSIDLYKGEKELWSYLCKTNTQNYLLVIWFRVIAVSSSQFFFFKVYKFSTVIFLLLLKWKKIKEKRKEKMSSFCQFSRTQKMCSHSVVSLEGECEHLGITFADGLHKKHMVDFLKENCCCRGTSCYLNLGRLGLFYAWLCSLRYVN